MLCTSRYTATGAKVVWLIRAWGRHSALCAQKRVMRECYLVPFLADEEEVARVRNVLIRSSFYISLVTRFCPS